MSHTPPLISSAELTALWRSTFPEISHDNLSHLLVSDEAKKQASDFILKHRYPLVEQKISARAGYIFNQAVDMVKRYNCDSIISFASGYSLLGFLIAQHCGDQVQVIDTDLPNILSDRQSRIESLTLTPKQKQILTQCYHLPFDIEKAATQRQDIAATFPDCKRPIIILEGITYFLQPSTRDWFINALTQWKSACLIIEYWPENALQISAKLKQSVDNHLSSDFKEELKSFLTDDLIKQVQSKYHSQDIGIGEAEKKLSKLVKQPNQLLNQDEFFPIRILTCVPKQLIKEATII